MWSSWFANVITLLLSSLGTGYKYLRMLFTYLQIQNKKVIALCNTSVTFKNCNRCKYCYCKTKNWIKSTLSDVSYTHVKSHPFSKFWIEVVEYKVRIYFRHSANVRNIMPHYRVGQGKISRWTKWKMRYYKTI